MVEAACLCDWPGIQVSNKKMFLSRSLVKIQYCGEPP